jgi:hypothetical protein
VKNPFDFANAVTDRLLFAGRRRELTEIEYYMALAQQQKGIGLAFVGERTSGKTSLLNMAQTCAESHGFLVVRLNLTTADVVNEESFLRSLYEAMFLSGRGSCVWRDTTEALYASFRDAMAGTDSGGLRAFCNIAFPQIAAAARRAGQDVLNFPVGLLVSDVAEFRRSFLGDRPNGVAILVDEGDHLARLPIALEKLRHLMSLADHLIVVIAGTDNMLGSMDAVFAPIVRQFKRVTLTPFISAAETRECLLQRLQRIGEAGVLSQDTYQHLHSLAQGHPYEAQLIAHYAYRRFAEYPDDGFCVTVSVLNEVLAQVERFRDSDHNRFAATLRRYDTETMGRLAAIALFPRLSLYDKARVDAALRFPGRVKARIAERRAELKGWAERFVDDKVLVYNKSTKGYELNGDQFDRLYAKLLARTKSIHWILDDRSLVEIAEEQAASALNGATDSRAYPNLILEAGATASDEHGRDDAELAFIETRFYEVLGRIVRYVRSWRFREEVRRVVGQLRAGQELPATVWMPTVVAEIGKCASRVAKGGALPTARVLLTNEGENRRSEIWLQPQELDEDLAEWEGRVERALREHHAGMEALGWTGTLIGVDVEEVAEAEAVLAIAASAGWDAAREDVLEEIAVVTVGRYKLGEAEQAQALSKLGSRFSDAANRWMHLNNMGYMLLSAGDLEGGEKALRESCEAIKHVRDLPSYNLAVCLALRGAEAEAGRMMTQLTTNISTERMGDDKVAVLLVLQRGSDDNRLQVEEMQEMSLLEAARRSLHAIADRTKTS